MKGNSYFSTNLLSMRPANVLTILLIVVAHFSMAQSSLDASIQQLMDEQEILGLSVAVVKDGKLIHTKAYGLKDVTTREPLKENDLFRIASISKSFSATSILQLIERKKVSLDDDIGDLIGFPVRNPRFPDKKITLRMVLSHTSSLNDSQGYFTLDVVNPSKNPDWAKCFSDYAPGEGYRYCNLNYNMVGTIIERLSGERFDTYVRNHILRPLDLYGGYCIDSLDAARFVTLHEYDSVSGFKPSPMAYAPRREEIANYTMGYSTPIFSPTGGMKISAPDLARYMIMHMNFGRKDGVKIISKKSSKIMQEPVAIKEQYALGLMRADNIVDGEVLVGHTGSAYGLYSAMFFDPKRKFGFVVITNGCRPFANTSVAPWRNAINILYDHYIRDTSDGADSK